MEKNKEILFEIFNKILVKELTNEQFEIVCKQPLVINILKEIDIILIEYMNEDIQLIKDQLRKEILLNNNLMTEMLLNKNKQITNNFILNILQIVIKKFKKDNIKDLSTYILYIIYSIIFYICKRNNFSTSKIELTSIIVDKIYLKLFAITQEKINIIKNFTIDVILENLSISQYINFQTITYNFKTKINIYINKNIYNLLEIKAGLLNDCVALQGVMYIKPRLWTYHKKKIDNNMYTGGFLLNKQLKLKNFVTSRYERSITYGDSGFYLYLETINKNQNTAYELDSSYVEDFLNDTAYYLDGTLLNDYTYEKFLDYKNKQFKSIFNYRDKYDEAKSKNKKRKVFTYEFINFKQEVLTNISKFYIKHLEYLFIKYALNKKCYFISFYDFRGRIYQAGLINITNSKLLRAVCCFEKSYEIDRKSLEKYIAESFQKAINFPIKYDTFEKANQTLIEGEEHLMKSDDEEKLHLYLLFKKLFIKNSLKMEGSFLDPNEKLTISNIFYQDTVANGMQLMLLIETDDIFTAYTTEKDYYYFTIKKFLNDFPHYKEELSIYPPEVQRDIFKRGIMTIAYGATKYTIMDYIQEKLNKYNYVSKTEKVCKLNLKYYSTLTIKFTENLINSYARYLICDFVPLLKNYVKIYKSLIAKNYGINVNYLYPLHRRKKYSYYFHGKKKNFITIKKMHKFDIRKTSTATYVNMIHSVESEICRHLIQKFPYITTIHDCYGVPFHQRKELRVAYKDKLMYNDRKLIAFHPMWHFWVWSYPATSAEKIKQYTGLDKNANYIQFLIQYRRFIKERGERLKNEVPDENLFS